MENDFSLAELQGALEQGAEIEFIYEGNRYSFSQSKNGIIFTNYNKPDEYSTYVSASEAISNTKINNLHLPEFWLNVNVLTWL